MIDAGAEPGHEMINRFTTAQSIEATPRWRFPAIMALAAMAALTALTADAAAKQARPAPPIETTAPRDAGEPIMAIVSIKSQRVTFYDADGWILRAPVSTGTTGRETPAGVFAVVEKDKEHHSSLYDDAWMPNMQRITWNGIALHGGPLPGYAASHGCVRMPYGFAEKLFDKTRIGMRVIISPNDAEPVEFSHPALFVPNPEAIAAAPAKAEALAREAAEAAKTADEAKKAAATAARETAALTASLRKLQALKTRADAELATPTRRSPPPRRTRPRRGPRTCKQKAAAKAAELGDAARRRQGRREIEARRRRRRKGCRQGGPDEEGRHRQSGERSEARARAGLDLHQPRDAKALRAAQHPQAGAGGGGEVFDATIEVPVTIRDPGQADRHACVHGDGAQRRRPALDRGHDRQRRRRQGCARPHHHPAGGARSHRADRIAAILDRHLGRAAEQRDQLSHRVRRGAEQSAARRLHHAQADGR